MRVVWAIIFVCAPAFAGLFCPRAILGHDTLDLRLVWPTQFETGHRAVGYRQNRLSTKDKQKLEKYLSRRPFPVIIGPEQVYVGDRQHLGRALLLNGITVARYEIEQDWRTLDQDAFEVRMVVEDRVRLKDALGRTRLFDELPQSLLDLKDDPYRSLAYFVRKAGGFRKCSTQFSEFAWADFFRQHIDVGTTDEQFYAAVGHGINWAHSDYAQHLPGYLSWADVQNESGEEDED
jgi:hypothetical protein